MKIATTRAGNVVGGGDWAADRIIPDCIRAWSKGEKAICRNPDATRPWQHVLEPLSGYLWLGASLLKHPEDTAGEAFNFGPDDKVIKSVRELVDLLAHYWGNAGWEHVGEKKAVKESKLLNLSCDKASNTLGWQPSLSFDEVVSLTADWYKCYYDGEKDIYDYTSSQIDLYMKKAAKLGAPWVNGK